MTPEGTPRDTGARLERAEIREWLESLDDVHRRHGAGETRRLLELLRDHASRKGVQSGLAVTTPYVNTIPRSAEPRYPGDWPLERQIKSLVRWNAMAMVVRANRENAGLGGHISTYASCATLFEVAFNHFLRARDGDGRGDTVFYQGHASPGVYARAFLEDLLTEEQLQNFRRECPPLKNTLYFLPRHPSIPRPTERR